MGANSGLPDTQTAGKAVLLVIDACTAFSIRLLLTAYSALRLSLAPHPAPRRAISGTTDKCTTYTAYYMACSYPVISAEPDRSDCGEARPVRVSPTLSQPH